MQRSIQQLAVVPVGLLLVGLVGLTSGRADEPQPPSRGASIVLAQPPRVIDGDTLDAIIEGHRVSVGLAGLAAPVGNTECGRRAADYLRELLADGVRLEDDAALPVFDARGRRTYVAWTLDGRSVAEEEVRAGLAASNVQSARVGDEIILAAEADAQAAARGCLWDASAG
jgi:endonuclease YncB( thermonuclease family)